jgi:hypothetical protein
MNMDRQNEIYGHVMQGSSRNKVRVSSAEVRSLQDNGTSIEDLLENLARKQNRVFLGSQEHLRLIPGHTPMTDTSWIAMIQALLPKDTYLEYPVRFGDNPVVGATVRGLNGRKVERQGTIYVVKKNACQHMPRTSAYILRNATPPIAQMPVYARSIRHPLYDQDKGMLVNLQKL